MSLPAPVLFLNAAPPLWPIALPVLAGMAAVYLLLPRPQRYPTWLGAAAAALALLLTGTLLVRTGAVMAETVLFYAFSAIAIVAGGLLVTQRNPAYAALSFALVVLSTCGLFLLQAAPFLMAATIVIYAGAIIVTFLFVLMLAQTEGSTDANDRSREPLLATTAGFVLLGALLYVLAVTYDTRTIDEFLTRAHDASQQESTEAMDKTLGGDKFFEDFAADLRKLKNAPDLRSFADNIEEDMQVQWAEGRRAGGAKGLETMRAALAKLEQEGLKARHQYGTLHPGGRPALSDYSGTPPTDPVRRDAQGNGELPAENVAYLGRSLFTDYLLAVELGGTLLLVATIGAIAVATRSGERAA